MEPTDLPPDFYRAAFEHAMVALIAIDDERRIVAANEKAATLLVAPVEALVGSSADDVTKLGQLSEQRWEILLAGGTLTTELTVATKDGKRRLRVAGKGNVQPGLHLLTLGDVTRDKEHELSSRRYDLLREHTHDILLFIGTDGRIVEANQAAERAYGFDRDELTTMNIRDLRHDATDFKDQFRTAIREGICFETSHRRKDGSTFPVEVSSQRTTVGGDVVLLSVIRDVTERMMLRAKLLEADRLSTFGMIAAGLAHEINNPLAYVLTNHELITRELPRLTDQARAAAAGEGGIEQLGTGLERCQSMLGVAMEGLERVRSIVHDLKTFSRADPVEAVLVDLHFVLDSALNVAQSELRHRARIERCYGELAPVRGSTSRLGQVFLNLVVNGAQAIPSGRPGPGLVRITTSTAPDGWACVEVSDDGVGMGPEALRRLFEPFHTTKPGEGTGLGLYITRSIVQQHGGTIDVRSEPGAGTTVTVKLPPYEPSLDSRSAAGGPSTDP